MAKVVSISGDHIFDTSEPNEQVIASIEWVLQKAKTGEIQSFFATGQTSDGCIWDARAGFHDYYKTLGALEELKRSYVERQARERGE
jgi:hypothetical protein